MKKTYISLVLIAFVAVVVMPTILKAQIDGTATGTPPGTPHRPAPTTIRQELRTDIQNKLSNAKINQDLRNTKLENRASSTKMMLGSSTRPWNGSTTPPRIEDRYASTTWSTSTMPLRGNGKGLGDNQENGRGNMADLRGYINNGKMMLQRFFEMRRGVIVAELQKALNNLHNVRDRIDSRITKAAASGRDMTKAKALLVTADAKIFLAQNAIDQIKAINASSSPLTLASTSTTSGFATSTIDLNRPRSAAMSAQKAIKEAQRALNDVIIAIAKAMGLKLGLDGHVATTTSTTTSTTTNTTIATTTNTTSTTTATTTP